MVKYSYEEAFKSSLEYFDGDELAAKVFLDKYALKNKEEEILEDNPDKMHWRLANEFARVERKKFRNPYSAEYIYSLFKDFDRIIPQGSPMFGIGNRYQTISISNCFVLDAPEDSYNSILDVDKQLVNISKRRGGVGIDISNLRPKGTHTNNAAKTSTGIVSWMERYSNSIREVGQHGRRGALMLSLSIHHPDILDFATVKNDNTKVTGANISVRLTKEFLDAAKNNTDYELCFPVDYKEKKIKPKVSKFVNAKEIWKVIIHSAWLRAEPGILMWDNILSGPADCYEKYKSISTNPCGEIAMPALESCRLLAINLFNYVNSPFTSKARFDFERFTKDSKIAQRLMDDVVDLESEKIDEILEKVENDPEDKKIKEDEINLWKRIKLINDECRRTGLGITALGDVMAALGIKYGSNESVKMTDEIYETLKLAAYESSIEMAEELGAFKDYDAELEKDNLFIQKIKSSRPDLYKRMVKSGRRNIALTTTAPTGTVSIMAQTSSGIEPVFNLGYKRRKKINPNDKTFKVDFVDQNGDSWQEFMVYHPKVKLWMDITGETDIEKSPWWGATANEIDWINRVKLQAAAQQHVCHSISSTLNLPENISEEKVAEIYETAFSYGLKGVTIYRENCRSGVLVNTDKKDTSVSKLKITHTNAPKRPKQVSCDVHHISLNNTRYYVVVGLLEEDPYEIFIGLNNDGEDDVFIPKSVKAGVLIKESKGKYILKNDDFSCTIRNTATDSNADVMARLLSTSLRHGSPIDFIVHQLEKTKGDLTSFSKVLCRVLKKYIKDGTAISGENCPECKGALVRASGCVSCSSCGWSKC